MRWLIWLLFTLIGFVLWFIIEDRYLICVWLGFTSSVTGMHYAEVWTSAPTEDNDQ